MAAATRSALHTPLCDRLGIRNPICQAGMAYLASDAAAFLTGQCIVIDGGLTITSPLTRMGDGYP
ncbi:MAG: hypothetical protein ACREJS_06575 [Candidatus Rokuibacteriota bacterium]